MPHRPEAASCTNLTSDHPYWRIKSGILANYPPLEGDARCDIAVLGAGITGALVAEALSAAGHDVIVLDSRDVGTGSTSASTALIQYEIDVHLVDLMARHGRELGGTAYRACYESIAMLEKLIGDLGLADCGYQRKESVYLASRRRDAAALREEGEARRRLGIEVDYLAPDEIRELFSFGGDGALRSLRAAEVDAYRLAHGLLGEFLRRGGRVFDRTAVSSVETGARGVVLHTSRGFRIRARRLVAAMGYETGELFDTARFVNLRSTFALASEPLDEVPGWWHRCLLWETARPYFYLRGDQDGRAILGGEDVPFRNARARDRLIPRKTRRLEKRFHGFFPAARMETAYAWAGTFGETEDGLAYIGSFRNHPLCYFALGFGGNGITYSVLAADIIRADLEGKIHPYAAPFRFDR